MAENEKLNYPVLDRLDRDGTYWPGDVVALTPEEAEPLIRLKVVGGQGEAPAGKPGKKAKDGEEVS